MSDKNLALARSTRRRYRRVKAELTKLFKGKTQSQALTKGNIEKYGEDVIKRHFLLANKSKSAPVKKAVKKKVAGKEAVEPTI